MSYRFDDKVAIVTGAVMAWGVPMRWNWRSVAPRSW